jgi:adenine C2-methylase RlmN of 23S rRNA A2503 and tRNA A37
MKQINQMKTDTLKSDTSSLSDLIVVQTVIMRKSGRTGVNSCFVTCKVKNFLLVQKPIVILLYIHK